LTFSSTGAILGLSRTGGEEMTQGERVNAIRKKKEMTMEQFGEKIGVQKSAVSKIEKDKVNLTEANIIAICREFDVNENWLRTGEGDMPRKLSEEEEIATLVSDVLEEGKDNPFYGIILEIIRTYNELSPASQAVLREASQKLVENLSRVGG
jgi:transcriptional regulator with XRE-family HTH domain